MYYEPVQSTELLLYLPATQVGDHRFISSSASFFDHVYTVTDYLHKVLPFPLELLHVQSCIDNATHTCIHTQGDFEEGIMHGVGKFTWTDGLIYEVTQMGIRYLHVQCTTYTDIVHVQMYVCSYMYM